MERGGTFVPSLSINIQERVTSIYREVTCVALQFSANEQAKLYSSTPPYNYYTNGKKYLEKVLSVMYTVEEQLFRRDTWSKHKADILSVDFKDIIYPHNRFIKSYHTCLLLPMLQSISPPTPIPTLKSVLGIS